MTFLKQLKQSEVGIGTYIRIRKDETVELGYENKRSQKEYDNTRLIIDPTPIIKVNDKKAFKCKVSWFNHDDRVIFPKVGNGNTEYDEKPSYTIVVEIDIEKLLTDKVYYELFMEELLDRKKTLKKIEESNECLVYIGKVKQQGIWEYDILLDREIYEKCHELKENIEKRKEYRNFEIERLKKERDELYKRIDEINSKIDELGNNKHK